MSTTHKHTSFERPNSEEHFLEMDNLEFTVLKDKVQELKRISRAEDVEEEKVDGAK